ncbi:uncharacterized protein CG5098 isoform X3 [Phlebotomus papatasi]|uniref:uncharacterized protein CG5098 isoform X3 n=1 Tax=Phlebotomus papatasi TaxID=29031 RepID=UPI0024837E57|nr:uncharacterized protein CG5098 isoform X3 [Phlebotomus papatasi]
MNEGNRGSAMSSGHSHGRLGQPPTTSWNHLQVPSYIPRQPQLAHLSNERPMTWHTPTPPPSDTLYNFMAANHKNPLDLNPLIPTFAPPSSAPFSGTMDLTVSSSVRNSSSPRNLQSPQQKNSCTNASPNTPSVIQSVPKEKNNGEMGPAGTLFVRDAKQINNDVAKVSNISEPVELVKEALYNTIKNHAPKCNSPIQPPAPPTRQSPAPSVSPPAVNQPNDLSSASTGHEMGLTVPQEENAQISPSTEDSVDSTGGRKRRKRKPNKTSRMENQDVEDVEEEMGVPCVELPRIAVPPTVPVNAIPETPETPEKRVDSSPRRRSRRKGADDAEPVETIDMIANTEEDTSVITVATRETGKSPEKEKQQEKKTQENGEKSQAATNAHFDEVENKLEQMFAGIDDRPAVSLNVTPEEVVPSTSKSGPKPVRKRALSKDEDVTKPKRRRRGRKPMAAKAADKGAVKRKKGRPRLKPLREEGGLQSSATDTTCSTPRFRGPYVQVRGNGVACVINTPQTEEDGEKGKGRLHSHASNERRKIRGLHVSTLSTKYDADTTDATWMCVFCKFGPHKMGLGDLFGPYTVSTTCEDFQLSQVEPSMDDFKSKRTKSTMIQRNPNSLPVVAAQTANADSGASTSGVKKKKKSLPDGATEAFPDIFVGMGRLSDDALEVWLHEDCIVWAPGVHIIGSRLVGLEAAVWGGSRHHCILCGKNGATIGCLERGCNEMIHVPCARQSNWQLSDEDFKSYCNKHASESSSESVKVNGQA